MKLLLSMLLCFLLCLATVPRGLAQGEPQQESSGNLSDQSIDELIVQLDADRFSDRQAATRELIRRGRRAIEPLAMHALQASPESSRRVKKCLEEIGTAGNEAVFYQSVGILQVLFGASNEKLNLEIQRLQQQWDVKRTLQAIEKLRELGAKVITRSPAAYTPILMEPAPSFQAVSKRKFKRLSKSQQEKEVRKILAGSIDENRERVLGDNELMQLDDPRTEAQRSIELLEMQLQRDPFQQGAFLINGTSNSNAGTTVHLGPGWRGEIPDLRHLRKISDLVTLTISEQAVGDALLYQLSKLASLTTIEFEKCKFAKSALATIELPVEVKTIRFRHQNIDVSTIDRLAEASQVKTLGFGNCAFSKAALAKIHRNEALTRLEFENASLDSDFLSRLNKMKGLRQLSLTSCRFPIPAFRLLNKQRPDLAIEFVPAAFLGVRSQAIGIDSQLGCKISEVISGSGADKGGLKIEDTIVQFDGQPIELFEDLRLHICQQRPGDTITLLIDRDGEKLEKKVTLTDYRDAPQQ